ncbi:MAG: flagellar hook-basal body complex protein, partial [Candidatus Margulisbacteria bacterium]|nr:flagellar hook-basal body complex protein [Candidatus Margulisiibacteriota bacterium]
PGYKALSNIISTDEKVNIVSKRLTVFTKGTFVETNSKLDAAIEGDGFFVVETPQGIAYTRDGRFMIDQDYRLVTMTGKYPVLTSAGQVYLTPSSGGGGMEIAISPQGSVIQDKTVLGTLLVVTFEDLSVLQRLNGSFFYVPESTKITGVAQEDVRIKAGYIEASNVDLSKQLIELPLNSRKYDANSKALQIIRRAQQTSREMGRVQ